MGALADETLTSYGSHLADARSVTVTSTTGQQLRFTAYGGHIVRVRGIRSGETFFADNRYEMVDPASHAGLGGTLRVVDGGNAFTITTAPADGIKVVLRKTRCASSSPAATMTPCSPGKTPPTA